MLKVQNISTGYGKNGQIFFNEENITGKTTA